MAALPPLPSARRVMGVSRAAAASFSPSIPFSVIRVSTSFFTVSARFLSTTGLYMDGPRTIPAKTADSTKSSC